MDDRGGRLGCGIVALIAMTLGCLFLLGFGIFALTVAEEPAIAYLCGGLGFFGLIGCIALGVVMIRNSREGITLESKQQWKTGILTDQVIKKDLYSQNKTMIIGWLATSGVLAFFAVMVVAFSDEMTEKAWIPVAAPFVTLFLGIKAIIDRKRNMAYRVETDKVLGGEIKVTFNVIGATRTRMPIKTPVLYLEKHGEYEINSTHIHAYIPPEALVEMIEPGEEVFVVYSAQSNELLHIYRKKYWRQ